MKTLLVGLLLLIQAAAVADNGTEIVLVYPGDNVTLPCYGPANTTHLLLEWTRPDLVSPEYVFFYRDGQPFTSYQHRSFVGRVELEDKEMKGGNMSLILKNVSSGDSGEYECRASSASKSILRTSPIRIITLEVQDSGGKAGRRGLYGLKASLSLLAVTGLIFVSWTLRKKPK